jgi:hypothetical protein
MRDLAILFIHLLTIIATMMRPGGSRAVVAESLLLKDQLIVLNRSRERSPSLRTTGRILAGLCTLVIRPYRFCRIAVVLRPSTLLAFHAALVQRKYRLLFTPKRRGKPGPKGPSPELVMAIVETKRRNQAGAAAESRSNFPWYLASRSTRTLYGAFSISIFALIPGRTARPGFRCSDIPKTVCLVLIYFAASR